MRNTKQKLLYVYSSPIFAERDQAILFEKFDVHMLYCSTDTYLSIISIIKYIWTSFRLVRDVKVVIFLMGGSHIWIPMIFAKLLGKKTIVILGGADSQSIPSLKYGLFYQSGIKREINSLMYCWANILAPVDESLIESVNTYADVLGDGYKVGVKEFLPDIDTPFIAIPTEYDSNFWSYYSDDRKGVIAVTPLDDDETFLLKGFDMILAIAREMPKVKFSIVGVDEVYRKTILDIPSNVTIYGFKSSIELVELYNQHQVYLLPSLSEGLPNVLCESMMCGCIPVASDVGGNKKAVGDIGYIIRERNLEAYKTAICNALLANEKDRRAARKRINALFGKGSRQKLLEETIENLIS